MPRGRKKRVITPEKIEKSVEVKKKVKKAILTYDKDKVIKLAKDTGLFKYNKKYRQWEIIIPLEEYEKI